jgi:tungstate transport system ATP-binding protein
MDRLNQSIYQIRYLEHCYTEQPALRIDKLSIPSNSIVGLIGPNGSGKSTLLKLLAFVEKPTSGEILFKGKPAEPFADSVRSQVALLAQESYLMKRSVFDNISYGLKKRKDKLHLKDRIYQALSWVGLPAESFAGRRWYELSGGEAQRVALAARLVLKPEVLLLDEPTTSIDGESIQLIKNASIRACREWGTTLVIANHDWMWLYEICDEILHLFKGRIFGVGMKNIVAGPWQTGADGKWEKILQGGQRIVALKPRDLNAVAVIEPDAILINPQDDKETPWDNILQGIISRLVLVKSTGDIVAIIIVDHITLTVILTKHQALSLNLYPDQEVFAAFSSLAVKWY